MKKIGKHRASKSHTSNQGRRQHAGEKRHQPRRFLLGENTGKRLHVYVCLWLCHRHSALAKYRQHHRQHRGGSLACKICFETFPTVSVVSRLHRTTFVFMLLLASVGVFMYLLLYHRAFQAQQRGVAAANTPPTPPTHPNRTISSSRTSMTDLPNVTLLFSR